MLRDELVNSGTSYQAKGDYLRRWAREIERMAGEYSDIRVSDDPWSLIEAGIRHAFSKGYFGTEYAVVIQSGRSLREKWPKLVAAARRRKSSAAGVSAEVIEFGRRYIEGV